MLLICALHPFLRRQFLHFLRLTEELLGRTSGGLSLSCTWLPSLSLAQHSILLLQFYYETRLFQIALMFGTLATWREVGLAARARSLTER